METKSQTFTKVVPSVVKPELFKMASTTTTLDYEYDVLSINGSESSFVIPPPIGPARGTTNLDSIEETTNALDLIKIDPVPDLISPLSSDDELDDLPIKTISNEQSTANYILNEDLMKSVAPLPNQKQLNTEFLFDVENDEEDEDMIITINPLTNKISESELAMKLTSLVSKKK